ncbi:DUF7860 family protein [Halobaculum gomorrense]|uniref:Uncharacterized protein n=1 Tax=Halobaculum gomorrense TaxID=43928 RepID=A0A1M5JMA3_9EURY|nr:hypothetical protein [Halobaculum gomorrense]SHG41706.1 hypothetical protein SAMN05443636_0179 [Halobaculum gomorrense]
MVGRYGDVNYPKLTKLSVLAFFALFVVTARLNAWLSMTGTAVPAWEEVLLVDIELLSVIGVFLSVFVFGVLLPLTE